MRKLVSLALMPALSVPGGSVTAEGQYGPLGRLNKLQRRTFILSPDPAEESALMQIRAMAEKMKRTLDDCRAAVCGRTPCVITQEDVLIEEYHPAGREERQGKT